jgi:hypothetical protein
MSTTLTLQPSARPASEPGGNARPGAILSTPGITVVEAPRFVRVYISGRSGFGAHGLLKSLSRGGLQVLVPVSVPVRTTVQVTVSGCEPVSADVFYCVRKNAVYQVGIVLRSRPKPEVAVGALAVMSELDEPFTSSRGHVVDIGRDSVSLLCKTAIRPEAWVRLEANGWILFGVVKGVIPTSMLASCVRVHLDAAFRAAASAGLGKAQGASETAVLRSSYGF